MSTVELAVARFEQGYSCSQAVFSALAEARGVDADLALRVASGFGGGIGRTGQTCGCVTGAIMAIGLTQPGLYPPGTSGDEIRAGKERAYALVQGFLAHFEQRHGSTVCNTLLGCDIATPEGRAQAREAGTFRTLCPKLVASAVEIVEGM